MLDTTPNTALEPAQTVPSPGFDPQTATVLRSKIGRPGIFERLVVILALFVFYHQTPNAWFVLIDRAVEDQSNPMTAMAELVLMLLAISRVIGNFDLWIRIIKLEPAVFLFPVWAMASIFWSANMEETLRRSVFLMMVTLFAGYLVMRFYLDETLELFSWMFVTSVVVNIGFVFLYPEYGIDNTGRWDGVFPQKNALGYIAALGIPTLLLTGRARPKWRFVFYLAALASAGLVLLSQSKTMLVVGFGACALLIVFQWFRARRTLRGAAIVGIGFSTLVSLAFATANLAVLARWLDKDVTLTGRVPMWQGIWPIALERWLVGWGWEASFTGPFPPVHEVLVTLNWNPGDSHNAPLHIFLELGVVGLTIFLFSYFRGTNRAIRALAITPGPVALWPITIFAMTALLSISESGIQSDPIGWTLYVVAALWAGAVTKRHFQSGANTTVS